MVPGSNCRTCGPASAAPIASCPMERVWCTRPALSRGISGCSISPRRRLARSPASAITAMSSAFDITPDGKEIVFDRLRDNSDIVLIDLPK